MYLMHKQLYYDLSYLFYTKIKQHTFCNLFYACDIFRAANQLSIITVY